MAQIRYIAIVISVVAPIKRAMVSRLEPVAYRIQEYSGIAIAKLVTAIRVGNFFRIPIITDSLPQSSLSRRAQTQMGISVGFLRAVR